eukprot:41208-Pleurochrysis_carterae.AAC.1
MAAAFGAEHRKRVVRRSKQRHALQQNKDEVAGHRSNVVCRPLSKNQLRTSRGSGRAKASWAMHIVRVRVGVGVGVGVRLGAPACVCSRACGYSGVSMCRRQASMPQSLAPGDRGDERGSTRDPSAESTSSVA